jgi:transcriptional regulator with XRE-family HTH domain
MEIDMHNALGHKLTTLREARGLKKVELAHLLRVSPAKVSHWELGRRRVSFSDATKLATVFGVPVEELASAVTSELETA